MRDVLWSDKALADKAEIIRYYKKHAGKKIAKQLEDSFNSIAESIAEEPESAQKSQRFPNVRRWIIRHWKLYYTFTEANLYIVRLWDTRRNPEDLSL